ncbi:MAG TPA: geranylgeranyl reductase family protein [Syntrophales bacterium]|nr:geranylgeranyl reductase family protein [Syntrophales bacterium]
MTQDVRCFDVIVVGAGPAGCHIAHVLAKHGRTVLVLEKYTFPRWKPCAGGISSKTAPYIPEELKVLFECTMRGAYMTYGDKHITHITTNDILGWMVHRELFDQAHLNLVKLSNAEVIENATVNFIREEKEFVSVETNRGLFKCLILVGADGVNSIVSKFLPGHENRTIGLAYEGEATFLKQELFQDVLFDFKKFPRGYGWIFPKKNHYSIGGFFYKKGVSGIRQLYEEFCNESPLISSCKTYRSKGYRIPHGGDTRKLNTNRLLLIGDAACLVDPLTGEGIYYAFRSGHLASKAILAFFDLGNALDEYSERVRKEIQNDLRYGRIFANFIFKYPKFSFFAFFKNKLLCKWFAELLTGKMTYRKICRQFILRGWLIPFYYNFSAKQQYKI